ncbi:hypothetical protein L6452_27651 [Arctium lappa]|uniref:Uncharacterized protein n=1 Tax=Arctium lappa TaxID=4217 RepID=A0ACB8ZXE2_ARCLA|nr:hypothetical protein L6452_27651 [Arctium lappa]
MMVVSQPQEGMAAESRPPLDHPTASQSQPSHSKSIPQSLLEKPTSPITQIYSRKKVRKAPSLPVPSPSKPLSPLREDSPLENIYRETTGVSSNPKEVLSEVEKEHMGEKGKKIEELKLIVLSQQEQILNLKQMGEQENAKFEGEQVTAEKVAQEAETQAAVETINTSGTSKATEMVNTAEPMEAVETMKEVLTYLEIAETLIKAKHDTPKVISKAKGVVIKERGDASNKQ